MGQNGRVPAPPPPPAARRLGCLSAYRFRAPWKFFCHRRIVFGAVDTFFARPAGVRLPVESIVHPNGGNNSRSWSLCLGTRRASCRACLGDQAQVSCGGRNRGRSGRPRATVEEGTACSEERKTPPSETE